MRIARLKGDIAEQKREEFGKDSGYRYGSEVVVSRPTKEGGPHTSKDIRGRRHGECLAFVLRILPVQQPEWA